MRVNERMKKVFSILLCLCMVLQYVPTTVHAAEEGNGGSAASNAAWKPLAISYQGEGKTVTVNNGVDACMIGLERPISTLQVIELKKAIISNQNVKAMLDIADLDSPDMLRLKNNETVFSDESSLAACGFGISSKESDQFTYEIFYQRLYHIALNETENGTITVEGAALYAAEGETVALTVTPDTGYVLETLTVGGENVTAQVVNNTYSFTMPAADVPGAANFIKCDHTGGTATCTAQAVCGTCGASYGDLNPANHSYTSGTCCGYCGSGPNPGDEESVWWTYAEGHLTIGGTGAMKPFSDYYDRPWNQYRNFITLLTIQEGVTSIGKFAFIDIPQIKSVIIPASVERVEYSAFGGSHDKTLLETVTFAEVSRLTTIEANAFTGNPNLKEITLPASVTSIGANAFTQNQTMTDIFVAEGNTAYKDIDGVLYTADGKTLICCPAGKTVEEYTVPEGVTTIEAEAFFGNAALQTLTLPKSVVTIGERAFDECDNLSTVNVPCSWDGSMDTFEDGVTVNKPVHTLDSTTGTCTICGVIAVVKVVKGDATTYYSTLAQGLSVGQSERCDIYPLADYAAAFEIPVYANFYGEGYTFSGDVTAKGSICSGTFSGTVTAENAIINGTFNGAVTTTSIIRDGIFTSTVSTTSAIDGGTFYGAVIINGETGYINCGTFNAEVTNNGTIHGNYGGSIILNSAVTNNGTIDNYYETVFSLGENFSITNGETGIIKCYAHIEKTAATCKEQAVCRLCGEGYGDYLLHSWADGSCSACGTPCAHSAFNEETGECDVCKKMAAVARIGSNYYLTLAEAATKVITEGETIAVLTDVTIGEGETVTFAAFAKLAVAEGKTVTCNGTVKIGEAEGIIFENTLYYYGGDVTNGGVSFGTLIHDFSRYIYYKAGNGYMLVIPATDTETAALELYNANCTDQRGAQDEESLIGTMEALEIRFYGNSTLTCLGGYIDGAVLRSKASVTMIGMDAGATLTMQGGSENGPSTLYGIQIENGDLVIQSGTVTVRSGDGGNSCCGASIAGTLTVAPGAVLNAAGGESLYGFYVGLSASEIVAEDRLNALALLPDESGAGHYQVYGNAVLEHNLNSVLEIDSEHSYKFSFTVPSGATLTVNSGVTLDLSTLTGEDIDLSSGTVINKGTILLPEGFDINDAPESGNIQIGEKSYTWDSANKKWICGEDSHVTELEENKATCTTQAVCDLCGTGYGELLDHVMDTATGLCTSGCGKLMAEASVTKSVAGGIVGIGGTTYYETLDGALQAVSSCTEGDNAVVTLLKDYSDGISVFSGVFTLNLNGKTVHVESTTNNAMGVSGGTVTVTGGTLSGTRTGVIVSGGILNVTKGTVVTTTLTHEATKSVDVRGGILNVTGGTITGPVKGVYVQENGTVNISGGIFRTEGMGDSGSVYLKGGTANISGGTFSDKYALNMEGGTVYVTGGTFQSGNRYALRVVGGTACVTGGTFTSNGYADIYCNNGTVTLDVNEETGVGAVFPDDLTVSGTTLNAILADGVSYWQGDKQLTVADDAEDILGGDVAVKAACGHSGNTNKPADNGDGTHSYTCSVCHATFTEEHNFGNDAHKCGCGVVETFTYQVEIYTMDAYGNYGDPETEEKSAPYGTQVNAAPNSGAEGFYLDTQNANSLLTATVPANNDLVLKVYIGRIQYPITWDLNGGGTYYNDLPESKYFGISQLNVWDGFVKEGHTFSHLEDAFGNRYVDGSPNGDYRRFYDVDMPVGGMTLKAIWTVNPYTLQVQDQALDVDYGTALDDTLADITPEKTGYTFTGWKFYLDEGCTEEYTGTTMPAYDLYAQPVFTPIEYSITWILNGCTVNLVYGSELPRNLPYTGNTDAHQLKVVLNDPAGYMLVGFKDGNGNELNYNLGNGYLLLPVTGDMIVEAVIEPKTYMATWESGDGGSYEKGFKYGETITIPDSEIFRETFRKAGYTLAGWKGYTAGMTMPVGGVTFKAKWQINPASLAVSSAPYTGQVHRPTVTVEGLTEGEDFDVSYPVDMTNAGEKVITVTGKLGGTTTVTYTIEKQQITVPTMSWTVPQNAVYNGTEYTATLDGTLPTGVVATLSGDKATNAGSYTAKAVFSLAEGYSADNYEIVNGADLTADWTIDKKNIANAEITLGTALTYNGKQQTQTVASVKIDGLTVTYTVSGNTGTDAKDYTLTVTGNGNFEGTAAADWTIAKKNISGATITLGDSLTYNGNEQTQEVAEVKIGDLVVTYDVTANKQLSADDYTLTVTGNGNFEGSATADWSIAKAKLTITANNNSITYGDVPAANGVTGTGFVSSESIADLSGELTYSYSYEQFGNVGTYKITPSGVTSNNYEITFADGTLTVNPKTITVKADAVSKTYGEADPALTYKVEGLVNGDELTGQPKRAAGENVGSYDIEQNTLTAGNNYRLTYTGAELTVNKRDMIITAKDQRITYGETISSTEITATGLVDGHSATVTLTPSTANVTVNGTITAGAAVISDDGTEVTDNYNVSYTSGKLVIEPDTSKIDALTTDNVTSANEEDIKSVQAMMENAESIKDKWNAITTTCEDLIERIEAVEAAKKESTDVAAAFNADTVNSTDKENLEQLAKNIEDLLDTDNLTEDERKALEEVLEQVEGMIDIIHETAEDSKDAAEIIDALDPATVTSADKDELEQAITTIDELLKDDHLTEEERKTLEEAKADAEDLIERIENAQDAADTENIEKVEDITSDNVKPEDKEALSDAKADLEKALEDNAGNYTEAEKKTIRDEIQRIEGTIEVLENVEDVTEAIITLSDTVEPDDEETAQKILDTKEAYDELTDHEKSLVGESAKEKLDALVAALTAYDIIKGDGGKWTRDSDGSLSFTANGPFSKFTGIKVDGKIVDAKHYAAKSGSTIITLKSSYLETLSSGVHAIVILYTNGETSGAFQIEEKETEPGQPTEPDMPTEPEETRPAETEPETSSPATGDDSNIMLYGSMFTMSFAVIVVLLLASKKRKQNCA